MILLLILNAMASEPEFCWQTCRMTLDGGLAACGTPQCGDEAKMLEAERASRMERDLFTRETSRNGKWGLSWKSAGNELILKKEK